MLLPRSTPSAQGVDARGLLAFLDAVERSGTDLHSLMVLRHGHVVAEGWWAPYGPSDVQLLYSLSKTFLAMGVGIAVGEGHFSVDDLVADLLPEHLPDPVPEHLREFRVRHALSMASGHHDDTIFELLLADGDIVRNYLAIPPDEPAGTVFAYNQGNPIVLSAIISERTGERLVDYLRPRLFDPLGIDDARWLPIAPGIDQGFSGLHVTTESIAKLGQLFLRDGRWGDEQIVPADYVRSCRERHVDNARHSTDPDWCQGYGYQTWICRHGAQRGDGAYGQLCVLLPEHDAVVVCTAEVLDMQAELDLVWDHLLPAFQPPAATVDGAAVDGAAVDGATVDSVDGGGAAGGSAGDVGLADAELAERLASLSTGTVPATSAEAGPGEAIDFAVVPTLETYTRRVEAVRAEPIVAGATGGGDGGVRLTVRVRGVDQVLEVHPGRWTPGTLGGLHTIFPEVSLYGGWVSATELHVDIVSLRTPHRLELRGSTVTGEMSVRWVLPPLPIPNFVG